MDARLISRLFVMLTTLVFSAAAAGASGDAAFDRLDTNKDGRLSPVEASKDSRLSSMWTAVDQDKSGAIERAEFSAFEAALDKAEPTGKTNPKSSVE